MIFTPHSPKQDLAIFSDKPIVVTATGIQWGKTRVGAAKVKMAMHKYRAKDDAFLVLAPTYKIMQQSTLPAFLQWMDGCGRYHKGDAVFEMSDGGICYLRTATDPDSIVGTTNVRFIWGDEAGLYSLYFWENIQARAAFKAAQICLTTSPYTLNWLYKEIIKPKLKYQDARPDVELIRARSDENPYFPKDVYEHRQKTMDARRFNAMFGGAWDKMEGLVYDCFSEEECTVHPFQLPIGTQFYAGVDWGTTNPFVIVVRAVTPDGYHYQVSEFYKTGYTITDMVQVARSMKMTYGIKMFYADPSEPGYIQEFNSAGISCVGAQNDIRLGLDLHYSLIKSGKHFLFKGDNRHTIDEYEMYHYSLEDDKVSPDKDVKNRLPVKQNDHAMDANRYVTVETFKRHEKKSPYTPSFQKDKGIDRIYNFRQRLMEREKEEDMEELG